MKTLLTFLLLTMATICYSQVETEVTDSVSTEQIPCPEIPTGDLPEFVVVFGDTVGVLVSVTQLQKMDSNEELLSLLLKMDTLSMDAEHYYINIVNNMDEKLTLYSNRINNLMKQTGKHETMLANLKNQLNNCDRRLELTEEQRENDAIIIKTFQEDVNKLKLQRLLSYSSSGLLGTATIIMTTLYILK